MGQGWAGWGWARLGGKLGKKGKARTGQRRIGCRGWLSSGLLPVESQVTKGPEMSRRGRLRDGGWREFGGGGAEATASSRGRQREPGNGAFVLGRWPREWCGRWWYGVAVST